MDKDDWSFEVEVEKTQVNKSDSEAPKEKGILKKTELAIDSDSIVRKRPRGSYVDPEDASEEADEIESTVSITKIFYGGIIDVLSVAFFLLAGGYLLPSIEEYLPMIKDVANAELIVGGVCYVLFSLGSCFILNNSIGRFLVRTVVLHKDGHAIRFGQLFIRDNVGRIISLATVVGLLYLFMNKRRRAAHDLIFQTAIFDK